MRTLIIIQLVLFITVVSTAQTLKTKKKNQ